VLLVGGWSGAARVQPQPVDPVTDTVSALAAVGTADRWVWKWSPEPGTRAWPSGYWAWPRRSGR